MDRLSDEELLVYSRQIVLKEIGYEGQIRLKNGRVLLVGLGGLGTPVSLQLAAMGAGYLRIADRDIVSLSDLHRQYLYDVESVGLPKVEVAESRLSALNPRIKIEPMPISIKTWNVEDLVKGVDVVVDGLDSVETRYLINRACVKSGIPYVYGGAIETQGNISTIISKRTPCLECFMPNLRDDDLPKCAVVGVYTPVIGLVASIEVSEVVRLLSGKEPGLAGKLICIDATDLSFEEVALVRNKGCPVCGEAAEKPSTRPSEELIEEQCSRSGKRTVVLTPKKALEVDLEEVIDNLKKFGYALDKKGKLGVTLTDQDGLTVSLLKTGVTVLQIPSTIESLKIGSDTVALFRELLIERLKMSEEAFPLEKTSE